MMFLAFAALFSLVSAALGPSPNVTQVAIDLLDANHILHFLDIIDAFGHISVRNPDNPSQFIMSFAIAPALANSSSLVTYDVFNATALHLTFDESVTGPDIPSSFLERFIHSQIYSAFPNVTSVLHTHTLEVLPFAGIGMGLRAQMGPAAAIGSLGTPIFDIESPSVDLAQDAPHDFLIRNADLGDALAGTFIDDSEFVLMRGHGMALRAPTVRHAVFRAFYAKQSATVQLQSSFLSSGLTHREVLDSRATFESDSLLGRAWDLWVQQVDKEGEGLYVNDLRSTGGEDKDDEEDE
ncbi:hypothetical protein VNI00_012855 [Paramarasmius palmivorus]|uniref:Class II aldolase/adducin N-terminal domain-containing protein n=1 Tax=Paramarasmius palmivorus TaxID=297713 RepID=A0AAW0C1W2_9AGAR